MRALIDDLNARAGQTPSFAFVLVRSDIAFSGQRDEYRQAKVRLAAYNSSRLMPRPAAGTIFVANAGVDGLGLRGGRGNLRSSSGRALNLVAHIWPFCPGELMGWQCDIIDDQDSWPGRTIFIPCLHNALKLGNNLVTRYVWAYPSKPSMVSEPEPLSVVRRSEAIAASRDPNGPSVLNRPGCRPIGIEDQRTGRLGRRRANMSPWCRPASHRRP